MGNTQGPDRLYERKGQHATTHFNNHTPHSALTHTYDSSPLPFFFPVIPSSLLLPLFLPFFLFLLLQVAALKERFVTGSWGKGRKKKGGGGDDDDDSEDLLAGDGDDSDSLVASDEDGTTMFNSFQMIV